MTRAVRRAPARIHVATAIVSIGLLAGSAVAAAPGATTGLGDVSGGRSPASARNVLEPAPGPALASARQPAVEAGPVAAAFNPTNVAIGLAPVATGFSKPVLVTHAGDGSGRLFVVEQTGKVRVIDGGTKLPTPFLDLSSAITTGGERGLLGLAFHPLYPTRPYIYVDFTDRNGNTAINRYTVSADPNVIDRASGVRILTIGQPYANHNGGHMAFGRDGYLYIATGDGGSAGDPGNRAQSLSSLLGKILRINIDRGSAGGRHYAIPATNPYVGRSGLDEIWARGLRNPWRWSFDRLTGQLWIGDVGQNRYEEIDRSSPSGSTPAGRAANFGWRVMEANACYRPSSRCSTSGLQRPQAAYAHSVTGADNCSVTGGYVYRGSDWPALVGGYLFGDYCSGRIWVMSAAAAPPVNETLVRDATASPSLHISSFGEDEDGELYLCDLGGTIYSIRATPKR